TIESHLAQVCEACRTFAEANARFCHGCGGALGEPVPTRKMVAKPPPEPRAADPFIYTLSDASEVPADSEDDTDEDLRPTRRSIAVPEGAIEVVEAAEDFDRRWDAFVACGPDAAAERERLATQLAEAATERGADSFEALLARQRATGVQDSGV